MSDGQQEVLDVLHHCGARMAQVRLVERLPFYDLVVIISAIVRTDGNFRFNKAGIVDRGL